MIARTKRWITEQLVLGEFSSQRQVVRRSLAMALRIAAIAYAMNVALHFLLYAAGLMPYDLGSALILATSLTPPVSFVIAFFAYYVVGMAVFELSISRAQFAEMSRIDSLSGLLNRRAFMERYDKAQGRAALVLFDVDRFKSINDTFGHGAGDDVIVGVGNALSASFRASDVVSRFGGEEYVVLICGLAAGECLELVERAKAAVQAHPIAIGNGEVPVTVSAGMASISDEMDFREIFARADKALYLAKAAGRNRIVHADTLATIGIDVAKPDPMPAFAG